MNLYVILVGFLAVSVNGDTKCGVYNCKGAAYKDSNGHFDCIIRNPKKDFDVYSCPRTDSISGERFGCDALLNINYYEDPEPEGPEQSPLECYDFQLPPGFRAKNSRECKVGILDETGYCRGLPRGMNCNLGSLSCDYGLSCVYIGSSYTCQPINTINNTRASCPFGYYNGRCIRYGTLDVGTPVSFLPWNLWLCKSYMADPITENCAQHGYQVLGSNTINLQSDLCDIYYQDQHVAHDWNLGGRTDYKYYLANGICCYSADGSAICPISSNQTKIYVEKIMDFVEAHLDKAVVITGTTDPLNYFGAFTTFGLTPVMEKYSGFDETLEAYCKLFYTPCGNTIECMRDQISYHNAATFHTEQLLSMCYEKGVFNTSNSWLWIALVSGGSLLLLAGAAFILFYYFFLKPEPTPI